jgi:hypothetical protein
VGLETLLGAGAGQLFRSQAVGPIEPMTTATTRGFQPSAAPHDVAAEMDRSGTVKGEARDNLSSLSRTSSHIPSDTYAHESMGPSKEVCATGNSNPKCGLFNAPPKGVK